MAALSTTTITVIITTTLLESPRHHPDTLPSNWSQGPFFFFFFIMVKCTRHNVCHFNHPKLSNSVTFCTFTMLCHCLVSEYFYHLSLYPFSTLPCVSGPSAWGIFQNQTLSSWLFGCSSCRRLKFKLTVLAQGLSDADFSSPSLTPGQQSSGGHEGSKRAPTGFQSFLKRTLSDQEQNYSALLFKVAI